MGTSGAVPVCSVCFETLGKYGGPTSLPCGHNGCLQCLAHVQRTKPQCPICRSPFSPGTALLVNTELRDLLQLATALTTTSLDGEGEWQAVTSARMGPGGGGKCDDPGVDDYARSVALVPSAPPLHVDLRAVLEGGADLMSLEPPKWAPDSSAAACRGCARPFQFVLRSRHHCRVCGDVFCGACTCARLLLPPKFLEREPQRCCGPCAEVLAPLQPLLAGTVSPAVQPPVHDTTDWSVWRSLLNSPLTQRLEDDIYKSVNIVRHFGGVGAFKPERGIPEAVLAGAAGLAILSVLKVGAGWSCGVGTGLVVARRADGSWSAPSSVLSVSAGAGWQVGGALTDVIVVLRNAAAVRAFCGSQLGLGGAVSVAAGPVGREAAAKLALGTSGSGAVCYSYSCSRGAFAGLVLEGTLLRSRDSVNQRFYGRPVPARSLLLSEAAAPPAAAAALYAALDELMRRVGDPNGVGQFSVAGSPLAVAAAGQRWGQAEGRAAAGAGGLRSLGWLGLGGAADPEAEGQGPPVGAYSGGSSGRAGGSAAQPLDIPGSPPRRGRGRERSLGPAGAGGMVGAGDVHGAVPVWAGSAPVYSGWDERQLPSLFD